MKILYNTGSEFKESKESAENLSVKIIDDNGNTVEKTVQELVSDNFYGIERLIGTEDVNDDHRSVREIARNEFAKQLIPEDAKESLDTLHEIADWIQDHPDDASQMNSRINTLEEAVPFVLYIQNGVYGYKKENGDFVPFKSQADIDAAVTAAKVGTATAADVLAGKTFTNSSESGVTGTMPSRSNGESAVSTDRANGNRVFFPRGHYPNYATHDGQSWVKVTDEQIVNFANKQERTVTSSTSDQTVTPDSGKLLSKVTVNKISPQRSLGTAATGSGIDSTGPYVYMPYGWWPEYSGKAGSSYTYMTAAQAVAACPKEERTVTAGTSAASITPNSGKLISKVTYNPTPSQSKSCTPSTTAQTIKPDAGKLLSQVSVSAISTQEKSTKPTTRSSTAATITPDSGKYLTKVTVDTTAVPNSNSGDYTCGSNNGAASSNDMGATNTYRRVNATNVYNYGVAAGKKAVTLSGYVQSNANSHSSEEIYIANPAGNASKIYIKTTYNSGSYIADDIIQIIYNNWSNYVNFPMNAFTNGVTKSYSNIVGFVLKFGTRSSYAKVSWTTSYTY